MNQFETLSRRGLLQGAVLAALAGRTVRGQAPVFSADVKVVNVFVTVRDKNGNIVTDLQKDDFVLGEDGRSQPIRYFTRQSDLPLTLGLLVDTTPSETKMLGVERRASDLFLEKVLRPEKDKAFLIQFNDNVELLQDLTSSREKLEKALDLLGDEEQVGGRRGRRGRGGADSTVLSDAIFLGADELLKKQQGRKAMIVLGDGDHIGDREEPAVASAQRADSLVYAIRIYDKDFGEGNGGGKGWHGLSVPNLAGIGGMGGAGGGGQGGPGGQRGPQNGPRRSDGKKRLQEIASKTGGTYFEVTKKESLEQIYGKIEEELRNQYSLGYTPDAEARSGYRRIKVSVKRPGLVIQGRDGYYGDATT